MFDQRWSGGARVAEVRRLCSRGGVRGGPWSSTPRPRVRGIPPVRLLWTGGARVAEVRSPCPRGEVRGGGSLVLYPRFSPRAGRGWRRCEVPARGVG